MSQTECNSLLEFFEVGRQQVTMSFDGESVVSDAGLLQIRELDHQLGKLQVTHTDTAENILTQQVYQILARLMSRDSPGRTFWPFQSPTNFSSYGEDKVVS